MDCPNKNVVSLMKRLQWHGTLLPPGEAAWVLCPVCRQDTFAAIVQGDDAGEPKLRGLVCLSETCEGDTVIDVTDGRFTDAEKRRPPT